MKMMLKTSLLQVLLYCSVHIHGLEIQSEPAQGVQGVLLTELDGTVSLTCLSPQDQLVWLRDGLPVRLQEGNAAGSSRLCVSPVTRQDDEVTFTCQLKTDASVNATVTLNVTYAPLLSGMQEVTLEEQAGLVLECDVRANPPVSVSWQQDGVLLDLSAGGFVVTNDGSVSRLAADSADRGLHQGTYDCVTHSSLYGVNRKSFQVTVTDKTMKFPMMPMAAGIVVVCCTTLLALVARWKKIAQCFK